MCILVDYIRNPMGRKCTVAFEDFKDLKDSCIMDLDKCGWDREDSIDFRSMDSCIKYLFRDHREVRYRKSTSFKKYNEYRYGKKAMMP